MYDREMLRKEVARQINIYDDFCVVFGTPTEAFEDKRRALYVIAKALVMSDTQLQFNCNVVYQFRTLEHTNVPKLVDKWCKRHGIELLNMEGI